jgi:hypothetical protein
VFFCSERRESDAVTRRRGERKEKYEPLCTLKMRSPIRPSFPPSQLLLNRSSYSNKDLSLGSDDARLRLSDRLGLGLLSLTSNGSLLLLLSVTLNRHLQRQRATVELLPLELLERLLLVLLAGKVDESEALGAAGGLAELATDDGGGLDGETLEDGRESGVVDLEGEVADEEGGLGLGAGRGAATTGSTGLGDRGTVDGGGKSGGSTILTLEETMDEERSERIGIGRERKGERTQQQPCPCGACEYGACGYGEQQSRPRGWYRRAGQRRRRRRWGRLRPPQSRRRHGEHGDHGPCAMRERKWGQCVTKRRKERKKTNGLASLASRSRTFRTLLSSDTLLSGLAGRRELSGLLSGAPGGTSSSRAADGSGLGDLDVDLAARDLGLVELGDGLDGVVLGGVGHEAVTV